MPSGVEAFQRKKQQKAAQKAQYGGDKIRPNYFAVQDKQYEIVRFLEQGDEITFADVHRVPIEGSRYPVDFICLDTNDDGTPCPGCQSSVDDIRKRRTRGYFNLIWRQGPVYGTTDKGWPDRSKITGRADGVFLWKTSWTVTEMLIEKDGKFKGLMSRDWEIKRTGSQMNDTVYHVEPADPDAGPQPMFIPDLALAEQKYDLAELTRPKSYEELSQILSTGAFLDGPQPTMDRRAVLPTAENTFTENQNPSVRASAFSR